MKTVFVVVKTSFQPCYDCGSVSHSTPFKVFSDEDSAKKFVEEKTFETGDGAWSPVWEVEEVEFFENVC